LSKWDLASLLPEMGKPTCEYQYRLSSFTPVLWAHKAIAMMSYQQLQEYPPAFTVALYCGCGCRICGAWHIDSGQMAWITPCLCLLLVVGPWIVSVPQYWGTCVGLEIVTHIQGSLIIYWGVNYDETNWVGWKVQGGEWWLGWGEHNILGSCQSHDEGTWAEGKGRSF
jgi:hypothetical protein